MDRALPVLLLAGTVFLWSANADWIRRADAATGHSLRFFIGSYSLAEGYSHQGYGMPYGGIDPEAMEAAQQIPPDTPIWSSNINAYCMVPGCRVESFVSYFMSPRLDEILVAPPERAKQLLREAGLNYFFLEKNSQMADLLPYSKLFAPGTIDKYLGVKWTDGTAYLLTWLGNDTTPLGPDFSTFYASRLAQPEDGWYALGQLAPQLAQATAMLRAKSWGAPAVFAWEAPPRDGTIDVVDATYGMTCRRYVEKPPQMNLAFDGNMTGLAHRMCLDQASCLFSVDASRIGDPANGCSKDFSIEYRCRRGGVTKTVRLPAEADGKSVTLDCTTPP